MTRIIRPAPPEIILEAERADQELNRSRGNSITATIAFWVVGLTGAYFLGRLLAGVL
jgi:hypothetical protein